MTSPEKTNISKAAEQMTFAADFDHNLSDKEKRKAAVKLDKLVESILEKFPDHVYDWSHLEANKDMDEDLSLFLQVPQEDRSSVDIVVRSTLSTDGIRSREISVAESRGIIDRKRHSYYIEGGQALRFDEDFSKLDDLGFPMELSVDINRRPVGVDEIDKLAELLGSAEPFNIHN